MPNQLPDKSSIIVKSHSDIHKALQRIEESAERANLALAILPSTPLRALESIKFKPIGSHPLCDRPLNFIEQVNQTFTYLVAVRAARLLMQWHDDAGGFILRPGAHAPKNTLDIESIKPGLVGAETFAAVCPENNSKLSKDLEKLASRAEKSRYVFFMSPAFPTTVRLRHKERNGVKVYSIGLDP